MTASLRLAAVALVVASAAALACDAELETTCVAGDGSCDQHQVTTGSDTTSSTAAGGGPVCYAGCDTDRVSGHSGEYPCEVEATMNNCRRCHTTPTQNGAPFSLSSYEDSQQLYFDVAIWARMQAAIVDDFMPLDPPKLGAVEKFHLLDAWACNCAPPRELGVTCP